MVVGGILGPRVEDSLFLATLAFLSLIVRVAPGSFTTTLAGAPAGARRIEKRRTWPRPDTALPPAAAGSSATAPPQTVPSRSATASRRVSFASPASSFTVMGPPSCDPF